MEKRQKIGPQRFWLLIRPYRKRLSRILTAIFIANLAGLVFPWGIKLILDEVIANRDLALLNRVTLALLFVLVLRFYFGFVREYLASALGERIVFDLRSRLYSKVQQLSVKYIDNNSKGTLISKIIGDVDQIRNFLFGSLLDFVYSFFNLFLVMVLLLALDWKLALVSMFSFPFFVITFIKLTPGLRKQHRIIRERHGKLSGRLHEVLNGMRIVAAFAREEQEAERFDRTQQDILQACLKSHKLGILLWLSSELFSSLGLTALLWFGSRAVFSGRVSLGTLMAFYSYLGMLFVPVLKLVLISNDYQEAAASMERIDEVLVQKPGLGQALQPEPLLLKGEIEFEKVFFCYGEEKPVLSDINLVLRPHQTVALVGKSGAGKSSLVNLLLRFYDPEQGRILIGGKDLKALDLKEYRSRIAMVLQDDYLFSATVKENIAYGNSHASFDQIRQAAELANAHQFIMELPQQYDSKIGERGIKLSYGQRQRLSISRALLRDPDLLILDEATSAVDSATEREIIEGAYKNLISGRTTLIIAHRLSTITFADTIVYLEQGRIAEQGSHSFLLEKEGLYWQMWQEQLKLPCLEGKQRS